MKPRVYITLPNGDGWVHKHVMFATIALLQDSRFTVRMDAPTHRPFENNLHHCIVDFMDNGDDFWLTMDSDNPPLGNPLDRVQDDLDVVGFPTPVYHNTNNGERPWYMNAYKRNFEEQGYNEFQPQDGLQEVDAVGTGCVLMARRVFEHPMMQSGAFTRKLDGRGRVRAGNDMAFCERAKESGFRVWADFERPCRHFVDGVELIELIQAVNQLKESSDDGNH